MSTTRYRVFVSHSSSDEGVARLLAQCVKHLGGVAILAEDHLKIGGPIADGLADLIRPCQEMLVLISPEFLKSDWLRYEFGVACGLKMPISPLLHMVSSREIHQYPLYGNMFNDRHHAELRDIGRYVNQLAQRINKTSTAVEYAANIAAFVADTMDEVNDVVERLRIIKESVEAA